MNLKKIYSALMLLVITSQLFANTLFTASEIVSEIKDSDIDIKEVASEESINEEKVIDKTTKATSSERATKQMSDYPGLGNQNTSPIGLASYLHPNEETDNKLQTIKDMQDTNSKYVAVEDVNANLVMEAIKGVDMSQGILPIEFDKSLSRDEVNELVKQRVNFTGTCWESDYYQMAMKKILTKVAPEDDCSYYMEDYAYYYNVKTEEFYPVDISVSIDYLDFYGDGGLFGLGFSYWQANFDGLLFDTRGVDELEYTISVFDKNNVEMNMPIVYRMRDMDMGGTLGFESDALHKLVTYYQNPETSIYGQYTHTHSEIVFNYESIYEFFKKAYEEQLFDIPKHRYLSRIAYDEDFDRSAYNEHPDIDNGNGKFIPEERGWNRLKFVESNGYTTLLDSWGTNSSGGISDETRTNAIDSEFVIVMNSSLSFSSNQSHTLFGKDPLTHSNFGQTYVLNPYRAMSRTIVTKNVTDNDNEIAEVGDTLNYTIEVTNVSQVVTEFDVLIRDSMLENLPSYLSWDGTIMIDGVETVLDPNNVEIILSQVAPETKVTIEYKIVVDSIPNDITSISNIVTNNGDEPVDICTPETFTFECDATETPVNAPTVISKKVSDSSGNGRVENEEKLSYTIEITNPNSNADATDVVVRDSLLENLPSYLTWDGNFTVDPTTVYTGDLATGDLTLETVSANSTVSITYDLLVGIVPSDVTQVVNIVTDNGMDPTDPDSCANADDCGEATIDLDGETKITKSVVDEDGNGLVAVGEKLNYIIEVSNTTGNHAYDILVRDSMLENLPEYVTFNDDVAIAGSTFTGSLVDGSLVLDKVLASETVTITYSMTVNDIPSGVVTFLNVVTDNGEDPTTVDPEVCDGVDCDKTSTEVEEAATTIKKSVVDSNVDGFVTIGETLSYTLEISNTTGNHAYDVAVRDSMLENLPEYVTFNDDVAIVGSTFTGSLVDGSLVLDKVLANEAVTITYSMTVNDIPNSVVTFLNVVTDNGEDPTTVDPEVCDGVDCSAATIDVYPADTIIEKSVVDSDGSGLLSNGETLTYTIKVSNPNGNHAYDVLVRDDMLESIPSFATFNDDVKITGSEFTGSLTEGTLVLDSVKAGEVVSIVYSLTINEVPTNTSEVINVVTDNGEDPSKIDSKTCGDSTDCASASISLIEIAITKTIVETGNIVIAIIISSILVLIALLFTKRKVNAIL